jgi:hypothetical protein
LLAAALCMRDDYAHAHPIILEARRFSSDPSTLEAMHWATSLVAIGLKDYAGAKAAVHASLQYAYQLRAPGRYMWHLPVAAMIVAHEDDPERAAEILGLIYHHPASPKPWLKHWPLLQQFLLNLEGQLNVRVYTSAWERGQTLDPEVVVMDLLKVMA